MRDRCGMFEEYRFNIVKHYSVICRFIFNSIFQIFSYKFDQEHCLRQNQLETRWNLCFRSKMNAKVVVAFACLVSTPSLKNFSFFVFNLWILMFKIFLIILIICRILNEVLQVSAGVCSCSRDKPKGKTQDTQQNNNQPASQSQVKIDHKWIYAIVY